jgi:hypothetical protein
VVRHFFVFGDRPPPATPEKVVEIESSQLNFGTVWNTDDFHWHAAIRNLSAQDLLVEVDPTCGCTSVEPASFVLDTGQRRSLTFRLDLCPVTLPGGEEIERPFDVTLYVYTTSQDAPRQRHHFTLQGRVKDAIRVAPVIQYGGAERLVEGQSPLPRSVPIRVLTPLVVLRAETESPDLVAAVTGQPDGSGERRLTVTPLESIPVGAFEREVRLQPVTASGEKLPSIPILVRGIKEPDVTFTPSHLQFVATETGDASETVTLWSRSGRPFVVDRVETVGVSVEPTDSALSERHEFKVSIASTPDQPATRQVTFLILADGESRTLLVPFSVHELQRSKAGPVAEK